MTGGMFWDDRAIPEILTHLAWVAQYPDVSNEPFPSEMPYVLETLKRFIKDTKDKQRFGVEAGVKAGKEFEKEVDKGVERIKELIRCRCGIEGCKEGQCPCLKVSRACSPWCLNHAKGSGSVKCREGK